MTEGGVLVTKTLLVTIEPILDELGDRAATGSYLDAYDKATGELLAQIEVDRNLHGSPMTYMLSRRITWRGGRAGLLSPGITLTSAVGIPASSRPREIRLTV